MDQKEYEDLISQNERKAKAGQWKTGISIIIVLLIASGWLFISVNSIENTNLKLTATDSSNRLVVSIKDSIIEEQSLRNKKYVNLLENEQDSFIHYRVISHEYVDSLQQIEKNLSDGYSQLRQEYDSLNHEYRSTKMEVDKLERRNKELRALTQSLRRQLKKQLHRNEEITKY
jgi:hypothetical protein